MAAGATMHLKKLATDERQLITRTVPKSDLGSLFGTFEPSLTIISESGLYKLIMRADSKAAQDFQNWVTREVLPSIRKTGGYLLNEDMRATAVADSRTEFPMPVSFSDALRLRPSKRM